MGIEKGIVSGNWWRNGWELSEQYISENDKQILRGLAEKVKKLAERPQEEEKVKLWTKHNDLEKTRPLFFCDPENGWREIIPRESLKCTGEMAKDWEMYLRKEICWGENIQDDRVIEAAFYMPICHHNPPKWGVEQKVKHSGVDGGSYVWEAPIKDFDKDMAKLKYPEIVVDYEATNKAVEIANDVLGDILDVSIRHKWWHAQWITRDYAELRGLEQMLMDFIEFPDEMHELMSFICEGYLRMVKYLEDNNLLFLNTGSAYVGSGGFGYTKQLPAEGFDPKHVRPKDMWNAMESQETGVVGPEMFGEFVLPYQKKMTEYFGLTAYGCCEPLNTRWNEVKTIRNLRRVSVSPWADRDLMMEYLGGDYIYSYKCMPTPLTRPDYDPDAQRADIAEFLKKSENCHVEIIMKDLNTISNCPENVYRWSKMMREEINKIF